MERKSYTIRLQENNKGEIEIKNIGKYNITREGDKLLLNIFKDRENELISICVEKIKSEYEKRGLIPHDVYSRIEFKTETVVRS